MDEHTGATSQTRSVKVNLLPREDSALVRRRRLARIAAAGLIVYVALLGLVYTGKLDAVADARDQRDTAQAEVIELRNRVTELQPYRELSNTVEARNAVLAKAMAEELSWATVLGELAVGFPGDASLLSLRTTAEVPEPLPGQPHPGDAVGVIEFHGYSVERFAPGVQRSLEEFAGMPDYFAAGLETAATTLIDETEVTAFTGSVRLEPGARTDRYADGLPEGARP